VKRGEIWTVTRDPVGGRELESTATCVIVSPPEIHDHLDLVLVAPVTTPRRPAGFRVPTKVAGEDGMILLEQLRALDKARLIRRLDTLDKQTLRAALAVLQTMFAP
jgi:mRNA interferase MazF